MAGNAITKFVERAFENAKGICGMTDDKVRGFHDGHHHIALVMVGLMLLAREHAESSRKESTGFRAEKS